MSDTGQPPQSALWAGAEFPPSQPEPLPRQPQPPQQPRFQSINRDQLLLRTVDVEKLVPPDHLVRAIWELVGQLDLAAFSAEVKALEGEAGRPPWHPRLLISLWIYAYSQKISSAREVQRRCEYDPAFQWLTGMEVVNHHSVGDFRVDHAAALDQLFARVLATLSSEGLIGLEGVVVHDGTKVQASASGKSFHREQTLRAHLAAAERRLREMGDPRQEGRSRSEAAQQRAVREKVEKMKRSVEELQKVQAAPKGKAEPSQRRASETDPEARIMKQSNGGFAPSHNVQISTDTAHGIIVAASVTQDCSDQHQMVPAIAEIQRQTGQAPEHLVVDEGYTTRENILAAADQGVDLIGSGLETQAPSTPRRFPQRGIDPAFYPDQFPYD